MESKGLDLELLRLELLSINGIFVIIPSYALETFIATKICGDAIASLVWSQVLVQK
jgi:hypothetical protein